MNGRSGDSARAAVRADQLRRDQRAQVVVGEHLDRVQLVRGAEPVEEVHERHPRRSVAAWATSARSWASCTDAEASSAKPVWRTAITSEWSPKIDSPCAASDARGHVQHRRGQLTGDLVHVRDHQQQALRGGERRRQRAALQRAVQRARRAALALHLHHRGHRAPDVGAPWLDHSSASSAIGEDGVIG